MEAFLYHYRIFLILLFLLGRVNDILGFCLTKLLLHVSNNTHLNTLINLKRHLHKRSVLLKHALALSSYEFTYSIGLSEHFIELDTRGRTKDGTIVLGGRSNINM